MAALTLLGLLASRIAAGAALDLAGRVLARSTTLPLAFPSTELFYSYQATNLLKFGGLLTLSVGAIVWVMRTRTRGWVRVYLLPAVLAVDLFVFGANFNTVSDPGLLRFTPDSARFLQTDRELFRIASFNHDDTLRPNTGMLFGLQDIRGYDTVIPRQYVEYWSQMEPPQGLLYSMIHKLVEADSLTSVFLDLLNVKYILTTQNIGLPGLREVYRGEINIYQNEDVLPRAFVVGQAEAAPAGGPYARMRRPDFDPRRTVVLDGPPDPTDPAATGTAEVVSYGPQRVTVAVRATGPAYLVLTDSYFDGWIAEIDGDAAPIRQADGIFRAVAVPAGDHAVVFRYAPAAFRNGLFVSGVSVLTIAFGFALIAWGRLLRRPGAISPAQRVARNSLTPMIAQLANKLIDFGFAIFTLRVLGPTDAGKLAFAIVVIGYFAIFSDFGLGTLLTREVAHDRSRSNHYLVNTIALRLWLCLASAPLLLGLIGLYAWRFDLTSDTAIALAIFGVGLIPSAVAAALSSLFSAHEQMEFPAAISVVTTLIRISLGAFVLLAGFGIVGLAIVSVVAGTATALIFFFLVRRVFFAPRWEPDGAFQKGMIGASYPLMLNNFLSTLFFRIDVLLLKPIRGDEAVGYYTTAYKFVDGLNLIPSFFTLALFPVFSRYAYSSRESLRAVFLLALKVLIVIAIPITVGTTVIADRIITLFFTDEFAPSIVALQVLIWFLPFSFINSVTHYVLIAVNQQRFLTIAFIVGATFNVIANLIVIPIYGLFGAATVTIISELVLMAPFFYGVYRHVGSVPVFRLLWRPAVAGALMGAAVWAAHDAHLIVIGLVAVAVYLPCLWLLQPFSTRERAILRSAVRRGGSADVPA